ncbi:MAG: type III pantothenate kinase [Sphingobacteriales bacterium]|nr:MAG: type III pantothenate kinase [Sphingobacteriales bacterium]
MNSLVIDIGNSLIKIAVFSAQKIVFLTKVDNLNNIDINAIVDKHQTQKIIVSSVRKTVEHSLSALAKKREILFFDNGTKTPINNYYQSPETLGLDRLGAVVGAKTLYENNAVLVIDAGTCITYDFVDEKSNYYGGSISPGINMRLKALNQQTGKLPLVHFDDNFTANFGANTQQAILSGVINGVLAEVKGFIESYNLLYADLKIILCGGDAPFFDTRFKNSIFAHQVISQPYLVLIGLNTIVNFKND